MFGNYTFADIYFLWLLLVIPLMIVWYWFKQSKNNPEIRISTLQAFENKSSSTRVILKHLLFVLRVFAVILLIIALARPQSSLNRQEFTTEGIDIVLAMDISSTMLSKDFNPDRLEASKEVADEFIDARPNDRIGLVIFSSESFTMCPLTTDHTVLKNLFMDIHSGMIQDGTAIGMGLATSVNRLKNSDAKSKVIILLTDGMNNAGSVDPLTAAEIAKTFGIRVYTIGIGTRGKALAPIGIYPNGQYVFDYVDVEIDEATLQKIANMTDGNYFRATDNKKLKEIYSKIDKLEKTKIDITEYSKKKEEFLPFVLLAGIFLLFEIILRNTVLRNIP